MKKTSTIHLVLVTTVLASCNPVLIPEQPPATEVDTTYYDYPGFYFNLYFNGPPYAFPCPPASIYRKGFWWHNHAFVVRGGFGKAAASTAS